MCVCVCFFVCLFVVELHDVSYIQMLSVAQQKRQLYINVQCRTTKTSATHQCSVSHNKDVSYIQMFSVAQQRCQLHTNVQCRKTKTSAIYKCSASHNKDVSYIQMFSVAQHSLMANLRRRQQKTVRWSPREVSRYFCPI